MTNLKRLLSMMLALSMVFSLVVPAAATETDAHDHAEEATQEETINMEAVLENITVNAADIELEVNVKNDLVLADPDTEVDEDDPAIIAFETELKEIKVWDEAAQEPVPLTEEQIQQVLGLYQQYLNYQVEHADVLGLQTPFFLQYNDDGEDGLGILGEMLVLSGVSVDAVRAGYMSYDDLTGMILNFYYGDQLGVEYYGSAIEAARDEILDLIEESGAQTEAQKLLVLNDWMAHINTFDMPYIMNNGKDEDEKPMVAENPVKHEHYDDVLATMTAVYEQILTDTFETQIRDGLEANFKTQYYTEFIKNVIYQGALAEARQEVIDSMRESEEWKAAYEEALEAEEQKVYDEAYAEYERNNHEHDVTVTFNWTEVYAEDGTTVTGWTCETAEAKCAVEGCTAELTATVEVKDETTPAKCTEEGETVYTATATVTTPGTEEGETVPVGEPVEETKEVVIAALGHKDEDENYICDECNAELEVPHVHQAVVTITWTREGDAAPVATATAACADETCTATLTASEPTVEHQISYATCEREGYDSYTATVATVTADDGKEVSAEYTYKDQMYGIKLEKLEHADGDGDGKCDTCGTAVEVEHEHTYTWTTTKEASCTEKGEETETCTCGAIRETREIEALGHKWVVDEEQTVEATCKKSGCIVKKCETCGEQEMEYPEELGHDFVDGVCTREGCGYKCEHTSATTDATVCPDCGCEDPWGLNSASSASAIPEFFSFFTKDTADTVAEAGEGETEDDTTGKTEDNTTGNTDGSTDGDDDTDPEEDPADAYAKSVVEEKHEEIEAAAEAAADEAINLDETVDQMVTGGTEDVDTDIETECWQGAEDYVAQEEVANALAEDPAGYIDSQEMFQQQVPVTDEKGDYVIGEDGNPVMMTLAEQAHAGWEQFWADAQENGVEVDPVNAPGHKMTVDEIVATQMDTPMDDLPEKYDENGEPVLDEDGNPVHMTPNEAVPVYAARAAAGLTDGIINYWEGSHFGALGFGTSVCLGYTKAFTYLVQCMHPEIYGVNGAGTDLSNAANWKTRDEIYVYNGDQIDIDQNYIVDAVRVTFDAEVTMFGQTEDNFNSDHFWNAVKVDGQWYYIDPCYTDVFTEVMMRDRVETDGQMNHLYFLFSHDSCVELYEGNYDEIKTLYDGVANDTRYEDSWISRIKSNTYFADGYAYYLYDSTDMLTMMEEYENEQSTESDMDDPLYKLVRHKLDGDDSGEGDEDYETLVVFNYTKDDDSEAVGRVWDPDTGATVDNELLTELWHKHAGYAEIYPSIEITAAYYGGKVYFNLANCILSYDVSTSEVAVVKEYNTVYGVRDDTNPFGGMAFTTTSSADSADFTVENHPLAGLTIKDDSTMYVSVATNFAFISGKSNRCDPASDGYGYEYEESNYNPDYNSYMDYSEYDDDELESYGYTKEINDNDEFMWTANFVDTISMSTLTHSHSYETVSIAAACGIDAYTENRCSSCGAIEADTRVYEEGTALEHHYVEFSETFYTKDDGDAWNTGICYVCTECGYAVTEPKKPSGMMADQDGSQEEYEEALAIYEAAKESAGHTYAPTGETWAEDNSTVTFSKLQCSAICPDRQPYLDCLLNDDTITITLEEEITLEVTETETVGTCSEGVTKIYKATGEVEVDGEVIPVTATKVEELEPTDCTYVDGVCSVCCSCMVKRIYGEDRISTALSVAEALKDALNVEKFDTIILAAGGSGKDQTKFADALSGSYLASTKKAPILLYTQGDLSEKNLAFIEENLNDNGTIYLLGGNVSIPVEVEEALTTAGYNTKRLGGDTRYETNLVILKEAGIETAEEILIAGGQAFADSLSASATGLPVMLVKGTGTVLNDAQIEFLKGLNGKKVTILGGSAAISAELEAAIEEAVGTDVERVFGETREHTSVMVAEKYFADADFALVTYSMMYPDGLAGGVLANVLGAPLLLTRSDKEAIANEYITQAGIESGYVLGGSAVMTDDTAKAVFGLSEEAVIYNAYYTE